jgi:predicted TIM-barrel fold metal-dependent hydrolase
MRARLARRRRVVVVLLGCVFAALPAGSVSAFGQTPAGSAAADNYEFNDSHFHLTNYIQRGTEIHRFLEIMGTRVGRVALFGIPLQQTWSYANSGDYGPSYYLQSDAPLYYYSFTDAFIAMAYRSLTKDQQRRFDPMITGFNPADMYAVDHIRRVLRTFPGVFEGIGEFSIHKEFVSSKIAGEVASLTNPALDSVLAFAGEAGMVVILHNDIDMPFAKPGVDPVYLAQMKTLLRHHQGTSVIWAHTGLGRVVSPSQPSPSADPAQRTPYHIEILQGILEDSSLKNVYFDISWDEVAKYILSTQRALDATAALINRFPDRFLFGTDEVAPTDQESYLKVFVQYGPLWAKLTPEASLKVRKVNFERLFDRARRDVRAWEKQDLARAQPASASGGVVFDQ